MKTSSIVTNKDYNYLIDSIRSAKTIKELESVKPEMIAFKTNCAEQGKSQFFPQYVDIYFYKHKGYLLNPERW